MTYLSSSMLLNELFKIIGAIKKIVKDPTAVSLFTMIERTVDSPYRNYELKHHYLDKLKQLVPYCYVNKILNLLVFHGPQILRKTSLYKKLYVQRLRFLKHLKEIIKVLESCHADFIVFKTLRPVPETPVDIDIVVKDSADLYTVLDGLRKKFSIKVWDFSIYSVGVYIKDLREFVDLYIKPHVANIVYLDSEPLLRHKIYIYVDEMGEEVYMPVPAPEYEFCLILGHATIKEGLLTLNDILSLVVYYSIAHRNTLFKVLSDQKMDIAFSLFVESLSSASFPVKLGTKNTLLALFKRGLKADTLASIPFSLYNIGSRLNRIVNRSRRVTYVRGLKR